MFLVDLGVIKVPEINTASFTGWQQDYINDNFPDGNVPVDVINFFTLTADVVDILATAADHIVDFVASPTAAQRAVVSTALGRLSLVSGSLGLAGSVAVDIIKINNAIDAGDIDGSLALVHRMGWGMVATAIGAAALVVFFRAGLL